MADAKSTLTWLLRDEVSGTARKIDGALGGLEKKAGTSGGVLGKLGEATGGLVSPLGLAAFGATALTGVLVGSVKAAIDEQKNIARMGAALQANIPDWNGNTDAIEAHIAKQEDLAFSDDSLRESLGMLVASTHDVQAAQDLQSIAMDLARAKNIDLATATEAVIKTSQGSTKEMKALGIAVTDGASAADNLGKVSKATAGQAAAYAGTMAGKWETFQNKLADVGEKLGGFLLPIIEGAMGFLTDTAIPAIQGVIDALGPVLTPIIQAVGFAFSVMGKAIGWVIDHVVRPAIDTVIKLIGFVRNAIDWIKSLNLMQGGKTGADYAAHLHNYAEGGTTAPGMAWVGEQGPELVRFSGGQQVYTASQSASMAGGGTPVQIPVVLDGREIARVVDKHLYYSAVMSAPARLRS